MKSIIKRHSLAESRACAYCPPALPALPALPAPPAHSYRQHLVLVHGDLVFHCEVCDLFVDRKDFIVHMSYHTRTYAAEERLRKMLRKKKKPVNAQPSPPAATPPAPAPAPAPQAAPKTETKPLIVKIKAKKPAVTTKTKTNVQVNEFSDHSDMDEFGPLPESVFEAIEDTQDGQHLEDNTNQTPKNEQLSDESNKSSLPENKNSSNPDHCLESNNSCAQSMNVVIKNTSNNTSNNLVSPAAKSAPKTADSHQTGLGKRNRNKLRKCPLCPKEYQASSSYFYHLKHTHKSSKEHECEVCGRKFGTRSCLTQHMTVHTGQCEFECKQCQKRFRSKAGLYIHEQTHGGTKSWTCSQCPAAFRWKTHLLRHALRHAGERRHACAACGRAFSVRADLLRHARTHSAGSFACDKCAQKFAQQRYLTVHIAKQHKANVRKSK